ncbi:SMP-30/gluconolactonase/LRE family protein [Ensifer sp. YR511]|uniref:SMP-30/gluconolactonase/LRE family protein n=1 Tax=Ensifer sp. YR511 TaxID=1855294 RepID=UPI0008901B0A|nr:SMP-30/gluconolactonase/LRE family protein [Ensifer sp. YR511]SDO07691.1 gluconolactonase [Ensifer sp. YR511]
MADFEVLDERFRKFFMGNAPVERLATGFRWLEGPVWFGDAQHLLFSDIPNDRMLRWTENAGVSVYRQPAGFTNGHTRDREGRLVSCEHGRRRVSRTELDGRVVTLVDRFEGKQLNSPNDVVVKSDGTIWFTDPPYGIMSDYEGDKAESETGQDVVYRYDPDTGSISIVCTTAVKPNGLAFSPDERTFYLTDTGGTHQPGLPGRIWAFDVERNGQALANNRIFATIRAGFADGFRCDEDGNVWTSAGTGVECYLPDGTLIGRIDVGEVVANVAFGGPKKNRLFICASTSLYAVYLNARGAQKP